MTPATPAPVGEVKPEPIQEPVPAAAGAPARSAIGESIEQVNRVIEELKRVLDQMEEVLETLELAERQKIDDEREIESLQHALRKLRRPGPVNPPGHWNG